MVFQVKDNINSTNQVPTTVVQYKGKDYLQVVIYKVVHKPQVTINKVVHKPLFPHKATNLSMV